MTEADSSPAALEAPQPVTPKLLGIPVIKWVFAVEYALQGLVNPFQGLTYQPFLRHSRLEYGLSEAATQHLFAKSYLAWTIKPVIGFLVDAYGRTRTLLLGLLFAAALGFLLTPFIARTPLMFLVSMLLLSVVLAATDVVVDRATILTSEQESAPTVRSKSTAVGLNQAICWTAIYASSIVAAVLGGFAAERMPFAVFVASLSVLPVGLLLLVLRLPPDRVPPIPLKRSMIQFWRGLHTGPILSVMLFYFVFNFQPAMGPLWTSHLLTDLHFTASEVGIADATGYAGSFVGVLAFAWKGVHWQDRFGHRQLFRIYIIVSVVVSLTQFVLVNPWFAQVTDALAAHIPILERQTVRVLYLSGYNFFQGTILAVVRMSTFSLVGAVIPVAAAGSLFAGFMSVSNLATAFSYSSGSWLYEHGRNWGLVRELEFSLFDCPLDLGGHLSVSMLLLIASLACLLSFACVHLLPNQRATTAPEPHECIGPERWNSLPKAVVLTANVVAIVVCLAGSGLSRLGLDPVSAVIAGFLLAVYSRKALLDLSLRLRTRVC